MNTKCIHAIIACLNHSLFCKSCHRSIACSRISYKTYGFLHLLNLCRDLKCCILSLLKTNLSCIRTRSEYESLSVLMIKLCLLSVCLHSFHKLLRISLWIIKIRKCYTIFKSSFHISIKGCILALNGILAYSIKTRQCFLELIMELICLINNSPHSNCASCDRS